MPAAQGASRGGRSWLQATEVGSEVVEKAFRSFGGLSRLPSCLGFVRTSVITKPMECVEQLFQNYKLRHSRKNNILQRIWSVKLSKVRVAAADQHGRHGANTSAIKPAISGQSRWEAVLTRVSA